MNNFQLSTLIKVDTAASDRTAGYGNSRDSHAITMEKINDNKLCDDVLVAALLKIFNATYANQLFPEMDCDYVTPEVMNDALVDVLLAWAGSCPDWHAGQNKFFSALAYVTGGDATKRIPIMRAWKWVKVLAENPEAKVPKKYRKKAA